MLQSLGSVGGVFGSGLLAACLWAPFIEEILFRAGVQRLLRLLLASPRAARLLASLAFGLAHLPAEAAMWPAALPGAIAAAAASHFCFGLCFERRGLPSAVGAHSAHNIAINVLDRCAKPRGCSSVRQFTPPRSSRGARESHRLNTLRSS